MRIESVRHGNGTGNGSRVSYPSGTRIQDTPAWRGDNRYGTPFAKLDHKKQLNVLLYFVGYCHAVRDKRIGRQTYKIRAYFLYQFCGELREAGFLIKSVLNVDQRHLTAVISRWGERELAPATLQQRFSLLRWFVAAIGKPGMVLGPERYGIKPEQIERQYVASEDKSWSAHDVVSVDIVAAALKIDTYVGHQLDLMRVFGLRVAEAIVIRPHSADRGSTLLVEEGTKGGRTRLVDIKTTDQRQVLDRSKLLAQTNRERSMCRPGKGTSSRQRTGSTTSPARSGSPGSNSASRPMGFVTSMPTTCTKT